MCFGPYPSETVGLLAALTLRYIHIHNVTNPPCLRRCIHQIDFQLESDVCAMSQ